MLNPGLEDYLMRLGRQDDPVLAEMEAYARETDFPIVGPLVGRVLQQLVQLMKARRIVELGSGYGYSAYWFARGMDESGEIHLTEFSEENLNRARDFLGRGKISCQVHFHQGDGLQVLDRLRGEFDIIFNDVKKQRYPVVFRQAGARLARGGLLISDNVLWHGQVLDEEPDESTRGILDYNQLIFESAEFLSSILPLRDGIAVSFKK